jgi:hypothetical protein
MNWKSSQSVQLIVSDLNEIAADAYRHRIRNRFKKGGNGAYDRSNGGMEYSLPKRLLRNMRARFEIVEVAAHTLSVRATSLEDPRCFINAVVDDRGRLTGLALPGSSPDPASPRRSPDSSPVFHSHTAPRPAVVFFEEQ